MGRREKKREILAPTPPPPFVARTLWGPHPSGTALRGIILGMGFTTSLGPGPAPIFSG